MGGAEATIETDKAKLAKTEKRINILNDKIIKAKVSKDTKAQIELGTEKKDLEEEAENIRSRLKKDYGVVAVPAEKISSDTSADVAVLKTKEARLSAAVRKANAAKAERESFWNKKLRFVRSWRLPCIQSTRRSPLPTRPRHHWL